MFWLQCEQLRKGNAVHVDVQHKQINFSARFSSANSISAWITWRSGRHRRSFHSSVSSKVWNCGQLPVATDGENGKLTERQPELGLTLPVKAVLFIVIAENETNASSSKTAPCLLSASFWEAPPLFRTTFWDASYCGKQNHNLLAKVCPLALVSASFGEAPPLFGSIFLDAS